MMNVLVTGGFGFIGYHLANNLSLDENTNVYIIDNFTKEATSKIGGKLFDSLIEKTNVCFINIDLTNKKELKKVLCGKIFDIVYHLAAINGTVNFYKKSTNVIENNLLSTIYLVQCLNENNCGRFVFTSSCEAYASTVQNGYASIPTDENVILSVEDVLNPRWSYGGTKIVEELYITNYCINSNIDFCILRYHNIYGIRDMNHVIPDLINKMDIFNDEPITVDIKGNDERSFLYIDDCIEYTKRLGAYSNTMNGIYNVGIQQEISILDLAVKMRKILNKEIDFKVYPSPKGSVTKRCPDMKKTIEAVDYYPKFNLTKGLKKIIDCYQEHKCII